MEKPRQVWVNITYARNSGDETDINEYNEGFTYTDPASGESDTIDVVLANINLRWAAAWMPQKGDKLTATIVQTSWNDPGKQIIFQCGEFCLDDLQYSGPDMTCSIGGVSVPEKIAFRSTERNKTWESATLKEIAQEIAAKYGLDLDYTGSPIKLGTLEQSKESDSGFLKKVCDDYGLSFKVYCGKIVIYDKQEFEAREPVAVLNRMDLQSWSYNNTLIGTYTGATIKYTSGDDDRELTCVVGGGERMLNINEKVENLQEAQIKACAKVNAENEKAETMTATIMADTDIVAGSTVLIEGLYHIDGKYFVDKVTHNVKPEDAYTMELELHKCQERIKEVFVMEIKEPLKQSGDNSGGLAVGDKVIVSGSAYWSGNGEKSNPCNGRVMYIVQVNSEYKYPYGISWHKDGARYGWCEESSLEKI